MKAHIKIGVLLPLLDQALISAAEQVEDARKVYIDTIEVNNKRGWIYCIYTGLTFGFNYIDLEVATAKAQFRLGDIESLIEAVELMQAQNIFEVILEDNEIKLLKQLIKVDLTKQSD